MSSTNLTRMRTLLSQGRFAEAELQARDILATSNNAYEHTHCSDNSQRVVAKRRWPCITLTGARRQVKHLTQICSLRAALHLPAPGNTNWRRCS